MRHPQVANLGSLHHLLPHFAALLQDLAGLGRSGNPRARQRSTPTCFPGSQISYRHLRAARLLNGLVEVQLQNVPCVRESVVRAQHSQVGCAEVERCNHCSATQSESVRVDHRPQFPVLANEFPHGFAHVLLHLNQNSFKSVRSCDFKRRHSALRRSVRRQHALIRVLTLTRRHIALRRPVRRQHALIRVLTLTKAGLSDTETQVYANSVGGFRAHWERDSGGFQGIPRDSGATCSLMCLAAPRKSWATSGTAGGFLPRSRPLL